MLSFVDLDNTLFDTKRLQDDCVVRLERDLGIRAKEYDEALAQVFVVNADIYSFRVHAELLSDISQKDKSTVVRYFADMYGNEDSERYVFPDAPDFLNACRVHGKTIILSFGTDEVQIPRIKKSGLLPYVDDAIVTQNKKSREIGAYLEKYSLPDRILMIDDSLKHLDDVREVYGSALTLHIARDPSVQTPAPHVRVSSLLEAVRHLD